MGRDKKRPEPKVEIRKTQVQTKTALRDAFFSKPVFTFDSPEDQLDYFFQSSGDFPEENKETFLKYLDEFENDAINVLTRLGYDGYDGLLKSNKVPDDGSTTQFATNLISWCRRTRRKAERNDYLGALCDMAYLAHFYSNMRLSVVEADAVRGKWHRQAHRRDYENHILPEWLRERPQFSTHAECDKLIAKRYGVKPSTIEKQRHRKKIRWSPPP